ncbi:MAG: adaptor protein MecA [Clostridiales bacterium]|nr:adaptor protein MecA [Clostridiales bacterium]
MITIEFRKMGEHTITCHVSEDEVIAMGFSMEEIITEGNRTQEFMNQVFMMAEQELDIKFTLGVKTVQMECHSDRTLTLTFSEHPTEEIMGRIKELVGGLLGSLSPERLKELEEMAAEMGDEDDDEDNIIIALRFGSLDKVIRFARRLQLTNMPESELIRYQDSLYLLIDTEGCQNSEIRALLMMADEYDVRHDFADTRLSFINEHGTSVIDTCALECLRRI